MLVFFTSKTLVKKIVSKLKSGPGAWPYLETSS